MRPRAHSQNFNLFHRAILEQHQIVLDYRGKRREICPYVLGHKKGKEAMLAYQFAGESTRPGSIPGWRCFYLEEVQAPTIRRGHGTAAPLIALSKAASIPCTSM